MRATHSPARVSLPAAALLVALGLLTNGILAAQPVPLSRGPELQQLNLLAGAWTGRLTRVLPSGEPLDVTPRLLFDWRLGRTWIRGYDTTELPGGSVIHSLTWITWSADEKSYVGSWQDNVFAGVVTFRGRFVAEGRLELDSGPFEREGQSQRIVYTYERSAANELCVEMRQGWDEDPLPVVLVGCLEKIG